MLTKIRKWGNSQGVRITRQMLDDAHISVGEEVDVSTKDGSIVIMPLQRIRGRHSLKTLVSRIPKNYRAEETSWGEPVGKEAW